MRVDHKMNDDYPWKIMIAKPKFPFFVTKAEITYLQYMHFVKIWRDIFLPFPTWDE